MKTLIHKLRKSEKGATAIEYGLIAALVAVAAIGSMGAIGDGVGEAFTDVKTELANEGFDGT
ncbi:MAG: Flp family type IVb pilin [Kordiimonas sp.]|nr:Flp family type IVb pilin [Kordiimonas sp.]|tara:strand:+ start:4446 stop:4631 length:186 start_codon:yes stop_codon:yes gene_type:complete